MRAVAFEDNKREPVGPILRGMMKYAPTSDIDIITVDDDFDKYEKVVIFVNRTHKMKPKETTAKVGWWMCDLRHPLELEPAPLKLDAIFLCNKEFTDAYNKRFESPVHYMPQSGIDEDILIGRKIEWDIVFIGNISSTRFHHNRFPIIENLMSKYEVKIIAGDKFTPDSKWIYKESPFSLSISPEAEGYTSNRTYNILSAGGFCLIKYFPGIEELFENHKHLAWFETPEEAVDIMDYYYDHPEEYERVKKEGLKLYQEKHTARHRLEEMFALL